MKLAYLKNVSSLKLDNDKCTGCGLCLQVCPHAVFSLNNRKIVINDPDACMECGACARNCQFSALTVKTGVGCAEAVINGLLRGTEPDCDCGKDNNCC